MIPDQETLTEAETLLAFNIEGQRRLLLAKGLELIAPHKTAATTASTLDQDCLYEICNTIGRSNDGRLVT